jgi:hypothetical protein
MATAYYYLGGVALILLLYGIRLIYQSNHKRKKQVKMRVDVNEPSNKMLAALDKALPSVPFLESYKTVLHNSMKAHLTDWLRKELEVYKSTPKPKVNMETFDPRKGLLIFGGASLFTQGEGVFEAWPEEVVATYRRAVGTFNHKVWGNVTLLEIWAADHFETHKAAVTHAILYAHGIGTNPSFLPFDVNPFLGTVGRTAAIHMPMTEKLEAAIIGNAVATSSEPKTKAKKTAVAKVPTEKKTPKAELKKVTKPAAKQAKPVAKKVAKSAQKKAAKPVAKKATPKKAAKKAKRK